MCRERTCRIVTFIEQNYSVCAPRARLGVRAIRWAIRQLRVEGATIVGLVFTGLLGWVRGVVESENKICMVRA